VSAELKSVVERVAAVEETRQTRKGADVDEANASSESKPTVSEEMNDLRVPSRCSACASANFAKRSPPPNPRNPLNSRKPTHD
jgi:hypothetical protein